MTVPAGFAALVAIALGLAACGADGGSDGTATSGSGWRHPDTGPRWEAVPQPAGGPPIAARLDRRSGIQFVRIEAGQFDMGGASVLDVPIRTVAITEPFLLGVTEVTQGQWRRYLAAREGAADPPRDDDDDSLPQREVSFDDAMAFCAAFGYRLPTEAEWEFACRGNHPGLPQGGDAQVLGWVYTNAGGGVHAVGQHAGGAFGLRDMIGNVWELCADRYRPGYPPAAPDAVVRDPVGPLEDPPEAMISALLPRGDVRVMRGGSWFSVPAPQPSDRGFVLRDERSVLVGFRVAMDVEAK